MTASLDVSLILCTSSPALAFEPLEESDPPLFELALESLLLESLLDDELLESLELESFWEASSSARAVRRASAMAAKNMRIKTFDRRIVFITAPFGTDYKPLGTLLNDDPFGIL